MSIFEAFVLFAVGLLVVLAGLDLALRASGALRLRLRRWFMRPARRFPR